MNLVKICSIFACITAVFAAKTPVLIWSPHRPLSDLPQSYAGSTVDSKSFHKDYLSPLSGNDGKALVVFKQDKLSVEDFTNHADVYNPNSDGGAFKNVKSAMDGQFSVHLPAVVDSVSVINTLSTSFPGEVIRVDNPDELNDKNLESSKSYLIIVTLQPVDASNEYASLKKNDEEIGKVLHVLKKREIKYSAIYTGEKSSKVDSSESVKGRQLLATEEATESNGTLYTKDGVMLFLTSVSVSIKEEKSEEKPFTDTCIFSDPSEVVVSDVTNSSFSMMLNLQGDKGNATIEFILATTPHYEYISMNETFSYKLFNDTEASKYDIDKMPMKFEIQATRGFCFHCTKLSAQPWLKNYNETDKSVSLFLNGFQLEAFNPRSNSTTRFSDDVWDCVGFFTIPIWMGIITTLLLAMILFFGLTMVANIKTMDRFDDPKGKTITVTVNE